MFRPPGRTLVKLGQVDADKSSRCRASMSVWFFLKFLTPKTYPILKSRFSISSKTLRLKNFMVFLLFSLFLCFFSLFMFYLRSGLDEDSYLWLGSSTLKRKWFCGNKVFVWDNYFGNGVVSCEFIIYHELTRHLFRLFIPAPIPCEGQVMSLYITRPIYALYFRFRSLVLSGLGLWSNFMI